MRFSIALRMSFSTVSNSGDWEASEEISVAKMTRNSNLESDDSFKRQQQKEENQRGTTVQLIGMRL